MHTHRNLKINRTPQRILRASIVNDHNASISTNNQRVYRLQSTLRTKNYPTYLTRSTNFMTQMCN
ncbi:hypothetical protein ACS0TY_004542 [Phlomoides rotata]